MEPGGESDDPLLTERVPGRTGRGKDHSCTLLLVAGLPVDPADVVHGCGVGEERAVAAGKAVEGGKVIEEPERKRRDRAAVGHVIRCNGSEPEECLALLFYRKGAAAGKGRSLPR